MTSLLDPHAAHGVCPGCLGEGPCLQACDIRACRANQLHRVPAEFARGLQQARSVGRSVKPWVLLAEPDAATGIVRAMRPDGHGPSELRLALVASEAAVIALETERAAAAAIRHPAVFAAIEHGRADGYVWALLPRVAYRPLAQEIALRAGQGRAFSARSQRGIARGLADVLTAAHRARIWHLHLTPEVALLTPEPPKIRVAGFGRASEDGAERSMPISFSAYHAPEQFLGGAIGPAADAYAMAAVLWAVATTKPPFSGATDLIRRKQAMRVENAETLPPAVARALTSGLDPRPEARPNVAELADQLDRALAD